MTVSSQTSSETFYGNSVTTVWDLPFRFFDNGDIVVLLVDPILQTTTPLVLGTDYTLTGAGLPEQFGTAPGKITTTVPVATGKQLLVERVMAAEQLTDIVNQGQFFPEVHEDVFDRLTMLIQQSNTDFSRALKRPPGKDYFDAQGYRISNVGNPTQDQDAVTKLYNEQYIAGLLSTFTGPLNNAANVMYIYPNGVARSVQSLSSYTDPLLGSKGIGHYKDGVTQWTVKDAINASDAAIAVNAGNIANNTAAITQLNFDTQLNRAQPLFSRSCNVLNAGHGVNIISDSIGAGAYQGNVWQNGWPSLLAKAIRHQFGAYNVGAIPMDSLFNPVPAYNTDQVHAVLWTGNWGTRVGNGPANGLYDWPVGLTGAAAGDAINGKTVTSSTNGAYVEITVPSFNQFVNIYYVGQPGGGKFDVSVNGVIVSELNTAITPKTYNLQYTLIAVDGGQGETVIRLTKKDSLPTEIQPVVRYQKIAGNPNEHFQLMNVNNFSISGRQLATMTEAGIIAATNCACVVLALGYNDVLADTDDTYYAAYLQRINWFIQYANVFRCLVVVADFCWYASPTGRRRAQLKRVATDTRGLYLGFPDKFYPQGQIPVDTTPAASELISPLNLFADNAHPNFKGNEMIFSAIANALGLFVNTRRSAILNDMPYPLKLSGVVKNKAGDISSVTRTNNGLLYSVGVTNNGANFASGSTALYTLPAKFYPSPAVRASTDVLRVTSAGVIDNMITTLVDGSGTGVVVNASVIEGSFVIADKTA